MGKVAGDEAARGRGGSDSRGTIKPSRYSRGGGSSGVLVRLSWEQEHEGAKADPRIRADRVFSSSDLMVTRAPHHERRATHAATNVHVSGVWNMLCRYRSTPWGRPNGVGARKPQLHSAGFCPSCPNLGLCWTRLYFPSSFLSLFFCPLRNTLIPSCWLSLSRRHPRTSARGLKGMDSEASRWTRGWSAHVPERSWGGAWLSD